MVGLTNIAHSCYVKIKDEPNIVQLVKFFAVSRADFEQVFQRLCLRRHILIVHVNVVKVGLRFKYSFCCTCDMM